MALRGLPAIFCNGTHNYQATSRFRTDRGFIRCSIPATEPDSNFKVGRSISPTVPAESELRTGRDRPAKFDNACLRSKVKPS